jgi:hypothetical protein
MTAAAYQLHYRPQTGTDVMPLVLLLQLLVLVLL